MWNIFKIDREKKPNIFLDILFLVIVQIFVMFAFCYAILAHLFDLLLHPKICFCRSICHMKYAHGLTHWSLGDVAVISNL